MRFDAEPEHADLDDIVNFLRRNRWHRSAAIVEAWEQTERNLRCSIRLLEQDKADLLARLQKHEPPAPVQRHEPVTYRSEWD